MLDFVRRVEHLSLPEAIARLDGSPGPLFVQPERGGLGTPRWIPATPPCSRRRGGSTPDSSGAAPPPGSTWPRGASARPRQPAWALGNIARSCNPEYDGLYAQLEQTQIGPEREALVKQLHDMDVQDYYGIPLVNRGFVSAHLNTLKGVRINGWGDSEMWKIAEWRR